MATLSRPPASTLPWASQAAGPKYVPNPYGFTSRLWPYNDDPDFMYRPHVFDPIFDAIDRAGGPLDSSVEREGEPLLQVQGSCLVRGITRRQMELSWMLLRRYQRELVAILEEGCRLAQVPWGDLSYRVADDDPTLQIRSQSHIFARLACITNDPAQGFSILTNNTHSFREAISKATAERLQQAWNNVLRKVLVMAVRMRTVHTRQLVEAMQDRLPAEIRELIYQYLLPDHQTAKLSYNVRDFKDTIGSVLPGVGSLELQVPGQTLDLAIHLERFENYTAKDLRCMFGKEDYKRIVILWVKSTSFALNASDIGFFTSADPFGVGFALVKHARLVRVHLWATGTTNRLHHVIGDIINIPDRLSLSAAGSKLRIVLCIVHGDGTTVNNEMHSTNRAQLRSAADTIRRVVQNTIASNQWTPDADKTEFEVWFECIRTSYGGRWSVPMTLGVHTLQGWEERIRRAEIPKEQAIASSKVQRFGATALYNDDALWNDLDRYEVPHPWGWSRHVYGADMTLQTFPLLACGSNRICPCDADEV
ncbi:hypothetical protein NX059_012320 [Plenodomus lindquistii]|nr:hypothetical protein NX059_012320 [Plenodomus lindquistii]